MAIVYSFGKVAGLFLFIQLIQLTVQIPHAYRVMEVIVEREPQNEQYLDYDKHSYDNVDGLQMFRDRRAFDRLDEGAFFGKRSLIPAFEIEKKAFDRVDENYFGLTKKKRAFDRISENHFGLQKRSVELSRFGNQKLKVPSGFDKVDNDGVAFKDNIGALYEQQNTQEPESM
uniref:Uncharacterized protein n=1 Tax=Rhabditophanes sp. KR3021 TaxID=114890 RepID=A0AC35THQ3_9BILA